MVVRMKKGCFVPAAPLLHVHLVRFKEKKIELILYHLYVRMQLHTRCACMLCPHPFIQRNSLLTSLIALSLSLSCNCSNRGWRRSEKTVAKSFCLNNNAGLVNLQKYARVKYWNTESGHSCCIHSLDAKFRHQDGMKVVFNWFFLKGERKFKSSLKRGLIIPKKGWRSVERRCGHGCGHRLGRDQTEKKKV